MHNSKVLIWLKSTSDPIVYHHVEAVYEKGLFLCVKMKDDTYDKYPIRDIFKVQQSPDSEKSEE